MPCQETQELITGFVDDQISVRERAELEQHLETCAACRNAVALEQRTKSRIHEAGRRLEAPRELHAALERQYGAQPGSLWSRVKTWSQWGLRPVPVMALVVVIAISLAFFMTNDRRAVPMETLAIHRAVISGNVDYAKAETPESVAQQLSRAVGERFAPPVYDLGQFGLHTAGGFRQELHDRDVLVTVYRGNTDTLTCHTFVGDERDIPEASQLVYDPLDGRKYFTFSDGDVNGVLQRYGDELCVLVSKLPMDELLQVARSVHPTHHG